MQLRLSGDVDAQTVAPLVDRIDAAARDRDHEVILDFELVEFAGAAALRLIVVAHNHGMHVTVRRPSRSFRRVLDAFPELADDITIDDR